MGENEPQSLRPLPVDLSEIDLIASTRAEEMSEPMIGYLDTETGAVHSVYLDALRCAEGDLDESDLDHWAAETLEIAVAITEDLTGRYERIEARESSEDYRTMERFATAAQTPGLQDDLFRALSGRKPFRRFREALESWPGAREAWFAYEEHVHREEIREWLQSLGIEAVDTSPSPRRPVPDTW